MATGNIVEYRLRLDASGVQAGAAEGATALDSIGQAGAANAALFAVAMLANEDPALRAKLDAFRAAQTEAARNMTLPVNA